MTPSYRRRSHAGWLVEQGHHAAHVYDIGLADAPDRAIWEEASRREAVLVSKDEDFVSLRTLLPDGPALVWVRLGNTTRRALLGWFETLLPEIERQFLEGETLIEIAPRGP
ncbi:MAG: DUF5615 family PIN-like protein [Gammaproteobacteria bacterium]|nr:DUF5615 family PIN-like protein [Gammaproteobacteria bacterium]